MVEVITVLGAIELIIGPELLGSSPDIGKDTRMEVRCFVMRPEGIAPIKVNQELVKCVDLCKRVQVLVNSRCEVMAFGGIVALAHDELVDFLRER